MPEIGALYYQIIDYPGGGRDDVHGYPLSLCLPDPKSGGDFSGVGCRSGGKRLVMFCSTSVVSTGVSLGCAGGVGLTERFWRGGGVETGVEGWVVRGEPG